MTAPKDDIPTRFRLAMRRFAATVSVISTIKDGTRHAMTATSVTSLSMTPPALLVCVYRQSRFHAALQDNDLFCVNVLHESQTDASQAFARPATGDEFDRHGWIERDGFGHLAEAQATLFCRIASRVVFGSHTVFIGEVLDADVRDSVAPLIFQNGSYGRCEPLPR